MDPFAFIIILLIVAIVGGTAAVVARGAGVWSPPTLPDWAVPRRLRLRPNTPVPADRAVERLAADRPDSVVVVTAPPATPSIEAETPAVEIQLRDHIEAEGRRLRELVVGFSQEVASRDDASREWRAAFAASQAAAWDRLRADLLAALTARETALGAREARVARDRREERRAEVTGELYARLARLEAAVAAVTNPILLPGEPYAPPIEFLAEALVWENWKDVGERAFAFADYFNAQRLQLADPVADAIGAFVTTLRGLLTRSVYPNLRPKPTPQELQTLRAALDQFASELPRVRAGLTDQYRSLFDHPLPPPDPS